MKNNKVYVIIAAFILLLGAFYLINSQKKEQDSTVNNTINNTAAGEEKTSMANPASVNCVEKGGKLNITKKPDGGEYGVCVFEDNRQCEEWALFRGECPEGGVKITGYDTETQKYCAITGGEVNKENCKLKDKSICKLQDYFEGKCPVKEELSTDTNKPNVITATFNCKDKKSVEAVFDDKSVALTLSDGRKTILNQAISASGARYANKDETFVFWNKGDTAFIEENSKTTYTDCVTNN